MKRMMITESVRNLLLDSDFLESVLGSPSMLGMSIV